ncbi:translation initiation factor 3 subunit G [Strigomonas culicis]|uniref:Translation initiation factor 3 subunit G n=1 Tax=Strigomonas culicis TaxID=28005 RepID=S9UKP2_9TRYP|nr:translation initiation factor 3 subunit G [Strigomonas culicis]EPY29901.1 translation initiation factor 3 subunit G [Strigomonas culicis]|eukprot:EPY29344.1 translation initiation factor 3 subunit G [Strigomonas culicis]
MENWAEQDEVQETYNDEVYDEEEAEENEELDEEERWKNSELVTEIETDPDGKQFEISKRVLKYHVMRPTTAADLRERMALYGKAKVEQDAFHQDKKNENKPFKTHMVAHDNPFALELGSADEFERNARNEVKRIINEFNAKSETEEKRKEESKPSGSTWGESRNTAMATQKSKDDYHLRIRVSNLSDNISEDDLRTLFAFQGTCVISRVYIPRDPATKNYRGFAFITYRDEEMVDTAVSKDGINFKHARLKVRRATEDSKAKNK